VAAAGDLDQLVSAHEAYLEALLRKVGESAAQGTAALPARQWNCTLDDAFVDGRFLLRESGAERTPRVLVACSMAGPDVPCRSRSWMRAPRHCVMRCTS
jgi:hypothetical protein